MDFLDVIDRLKASANPVTEQSNPVKSDGFLETMPGSMPLTNRLDKMTRVSSNMGNRKRGRVDRISSGATGEAGHQTYQLLSMESNPYKTVRYQMRTAYKAICEVVDRVWKGLTDNMKRKTLRATRSIQDWVSTLEWAIKALPEGYERQRDIFHGGIGNVAICEVDETASNEKGSII